MRFFRRAAASKTDRVRRLSRYNRGWEFGCEERWQVEKSCEFTDEDEIDGYLDALDFRYLPPKR